MRRVLELAAGIVLVRLLGRPARRPQRRASPRGPGQAPAAPRRAAATRPAGRPRGTLVPITLGALAVGALLMLLFEAWYTRLVGVLALFTFVVAGVFLITGSGLLDPEEDG